MSTLEFFQQVQASPFSKHIGHLNHLFGATLELAHILGMLLVLSPVVLVGLRLLNLGLRRASLPELVRATSKLIWVGLGLLAVSGTLILIPAATSYYPNSFLWYKFILLGLALLVHLTLYRAITRSEYPNRLLAGFTSVLALGLWFGVAFAGRFIGFF
ncbi:DUF6644 family protein [Methylococcus sp. EFPC2]|uniref:DUF6644 family protein n=1 Tax=Methylococcus sp. EFPC2 TaxID=2812648 RepID=UPI001967049E|nr:DUF6644 family protein [Methylococcus sp. EFPC2]QSA95490.1 hypothetical protein JWZ97_09480 [Methylococcus sp. EFPC2]